MPNATLNSFSEFTQGKASQIRNCANEHEMRAWFEALFLEKFDGQDARARKAWAWCSTVGRKHMLREGASEPFRPRRDVLASWPRWIRDAIKAGKPLSALSLAPSERDLFSSILDWMRSPSGPSLTSDWSKISAPQAKAAELAWIDAMAKAAAKKDLEAVDAAGTELFAPLGAGGPPSCPGSGPEWAGWRWVEVKSADALDREGALMRHCVGSYAEDVASEKKRIYSLRDPSNAPKLTVEAEGAALVQIKALANAMCPAELRPAVAGFVKAFEADVAARGLGEASASDDLSVAGVGLLPGLGLAAAVLSARQAEILRGWAKAAEEGGEDAKKRLNTLLPKLAGMGLAAELATTLRFSVPASRLQALVEAAGNGHAECVKLLILVSDPKANDSEALRWATAGGHIECVKLLLSVSDPAADDSFALRWATAGGHIECVKLLIPFSDSKALSAALCNAARFGADECVKLLIPVSDPKADDSKALCEAAQYGNVECVRLLIPVSDPAADNFFVLRWAAYGGHAECVKLLIPFSDPEALSVALYNAAAKGRLECVALLLSVLDPKTDASAALSRAAERGNIDCVKLLLSISDPKANNSEALRLAAQCGQVDCVALLLPLSDPRARDEHGRTAQDLAIKACHPEVEIMIWRFIKSEYEAQALPSIGLNGGRPRPPSR